MDALNFLKFWKNANMNTTSTTVPHLVVETDSESDEEDSFFDLELTLHDIDNKESNINNKENNINKKTTETPQDQTARETNGLCSKQELSKTPKNAENTEPISKRKILPIEPISKPQSPISLLKSAPSFRISMFRNHKTVASPKKKTQEPVKTQKKETKVFAVKVNIEEFQCSPSLSRVSSTKSFGNRVPNNGSEEPRAERFSKEAMQKYLKLIKPLYVMVSKRYSDKVKVSSGEGSMASPLSSPSMASVSSRKEKQGMRSVSKHLGKSKSSSTMAGVGSPAKWSDDTLQQQHDGIQSAILHCKRSFNSRDSSVALSEEASVHSVRSSFEDEFEVKV